MGRRYHSDQNRQSALKTVVFVTVLAISIATGARAQTPKDCVALADGVPETVHEGRYSILCVRPTPGPLTLRCRADGVPGPSLLRIYPHALDGARERILEIATDGALPPIDGTAGADAVVFFSYDGPFDPIRDRYTLTCRW